MRNLFSICSADSANIWRILLHVLSCYFPCIVQARRFFGRSYPQTEMFVDHTHDIVLNLGVNLSLAIISFRQNQYRREKLIPAQMFVALFE
jgi:hypothetical protein